MRFLFVRGGADINLRCQSFGAIAENLNRHNRCKLALEKDVRLQKFVDYLLLVGTDWYTTLARIARLV